MPGNWPKSALQRESHLSAQTCVVRCPSMADQPCALVAIRYARSSCADETVGTSLTVTVMQNRGSLQGPPRCAPDRWC